MNSDAQIDHLVKKWSIPRDEAKRMLAKWNDVAVTDGGSDE